MSGTIDLRGAYDALEKAKLGEPIFVLLGRDHAGPATLTEWCRLRRNQAFKRFGGSERVTDKELLAAELRQCAEAEEMAERFAEWRTGHQQQEGERAAYQDVVKSAEEQAEASRLKSRAQAVRDAREADYHVCELRDRLADLGLLPESTARDLEMMMARLKGLAEEHEAKRPNYSAEPPLQLEQSE